MTANRITFAGLSIVVVNGWFDVTDDLPEGSPQTLAKSDSGIGALQFSVARYQAGSRPNVRGEDLRELLEEFAHDHGLGQPSNINELSGSPQSISGDFSSEAEFIRIWYVTNGSDVVLVSYVTQETLNALLPGELSEAEAIVRSIAFP